MAMLGSPATAADSAKTVNTSASDLSLTGSYSGSSLPSTSSDMEFTGSYTTTTFNLNTGTLTPGTLDDLDLTQSLVISETGAATGTITLNDASGNSLSGTNADLLWVKSGANLTIQQGTGSLTLKTAASGNFDNAGTLSISAPLSIGAGTTLTFTGAGTTTVNGNIAATTGAVTINDGTGSVTFGGTESYTGATAVNGGTLTVTGALGNTAVTVGAGTLKLNNASAISKNTLTVNNASGVVTENTANAFGGTAALTQSAGSVTLSQANNFSGATSLSGGTLQLQNAGSIGSSALGISGGTLQLRNDTNNTTFTDSSTTISGSATIDVDDVSAGASGNTLKLGAIGMGGNNLTLTNNAGASNYNLTTGTITASASPTFTNNMVNGTTTINSVISTSTSSLTTINFGGSSASATTSVGAINNNTTHAVAVSQSGSGTLVLTAANNYSGGTTVSGGELDVVSPATLGATTGALTVTGSTAGTTLDLGGTSQTVGAVSIGGTASTIQNGNLTGTSYAATNTGTSTVSANLKGTGALTMSGSGALVLSGNNTYSGGTTVTAGTLDINNAGTSTTNSALGTGQLTIGQTSSTVAINNTGGNDITLATNNVVEIDDDFTFGGSNDLTFGTGAVSIFGTNANSNSSETITLGGTGSTLTFNGAVTEGSHNGDQTLTVNGPGNTLVFGSTYALNARSGGNTTIIAGNGNVTIDGAVTPGGDTGNDLSYSGTGTLTLLSGSSTFVGGVNLTKGTIVVGASTVNGTTITSGPLGKGSLDISSGTTFEDDGDDITLANSVTNAGTVTFGSTGDGSLTFDGTGLTTKATFSLLGNSTLTVNNTTTIKDAVTDGSSTFNLTKNGPGTLILTGANTYGGVTTISSGILSTNLLANGSTASGIGQSSNSASNLVLNGGTLQYTGGTVSTNRAYTLGTSGGTIDASGTGALTISGNMTASGNSGTQSLTLTGTNTAANTLSGTINNGTISNKTALIKTGNGTWVLSGANTFTGGVSINGGVLNLGIAQATTTGPLGGGTGSLPTGTISFGGGTLQYSSVNATDYSSKFSNAASQAYSIDTNGRSVIFASALTSSGGTLTKLGTGALTLTAADTYTGNTTIAAGTLALSGSGAFANSPVIDVGNTGSTGTILDVSADSAFSFGSGQTLEGIGTVNIGAGKTVTVNGHLAPGNSIGTLAVTGNLTLGGGSNTDIQLGAPGTANTLAAGGSSDRTTVTGTLALGGTLNLTDNANAGGLGSAGPGSYLLFTESGAPTGSFSSISALTIGSTVYHPVINTSSILGDTFLDIFRLAAATAPSSPVALGNVRVGTALTSSTSIANTAATDGFSENLNATVTGGGTGFTGVAPGSSGTVNYSLATTTAGPQSGSNSVTLASTGSGTFGSTTLSTTSVSITGAAYDFANPTYTLTLAIGNVRVGTTTNKSVANTTITNASYQDGLDVTATNGGNSKLTVTNPGKIAAGTSGSIGYTAHEAGSLAATSLVGLVSDANGVASLSNTPLTGSSIAVTGAAYDYASPTLNTTGPVDFGTVHQGATAPTGNVSISNTTITNASFQDNLDASASSNNSSVTGNSTDIVAGTSGNVTLTANTSIAGSLASTVSLGYTSNANGVAGLSNTALTGGTITTTGEVYSGHSVWAGTGASGSWGTFASGFGANWGTFQGSPGLGSGFTGVDTATFDNVAGHSTVAVNLDGASPNVNSVTFNGSSTSYDLAQGTGGAVTFSGTTPSINVTAGSQTISAPIVLAAGTSIDASATTQLKMTGVISGNGSLSNTGAGTTVLTNANTYLGGTTLKAGALYADGGVAGASSATGAGAISVSSGATLAGAGVIRPTVASAGIALASGSTLFSGDVATGTTATAGLTLDNRLAKGTILDASLGNVTLSFNLGSGTNGLTGSTAGQAAFNFANPNIDSSFITVLDDGGLDSVGELKFANGDIIQLNDLTGGALQLNQATSYLLIHAGSNADYAGLVTSGGVIGTVPQNGWVENLVVTGTGADYVATRLYLFDGNLEVVPEPGTWALMIGGIAVLFFYQRRRKI